MCTPNESVFRNAWMVAVLAGVLTSSSGCGGGQATSSPPNTTPTIESSGAATGPTTSSASSASAPDMPSPPSTTTNDSSSESGAARPVASSADNAGGSDSAGAGSRDLNDIRTTISGNRDRFRACYDQALKKHPGIEGKYVLHFVLHPQGTLKSAEVDTAASQIHADDMGQCMIGVLKTLKFAPSKKGMESTVNYPFDFHPRGPAKQ